MQWNVDIFGAWDEEKEWLRLIWYPEHFHFNGGYGVAKYQ